MSEPAVHPLALCETDRIGVDSVIEAFAVVAAGSILGARVVVARGACVLGGAEIRERVRVEVGAVVGSNVCIQAGAVVVCLLRHSSRRGTGTTPCTASEQRL